MPMAKSRRVTKSRTSARKPARVAKKRAQVDTPQAQEGRWRRVHPPESRSRRSVRRRSPPRRRRPRPSKPVPPPPPPPPPQPPPRKPTYHEAVAMYERGLQALQRRDFAASADALRTVIERYPDERELLERARLYLKVCERELEPKEPAPKTADEWVYAATVAQNSGDDASGPQAPAARAQRRCPARPCALHDGRRQPLSGTTRSRRSTTSAAPSRSTRKTVRARARIRISTASATTRGSGPRSRRLRPKAHPRNPRRRCGCRRRHVQHASLVAD